MSVSVAAIQPSVIIFREEQNFDWRVYALIGAIELLVWAGLLWCFEHVPDAAGLARLGTLEMGLGAAVGLLLPVVLVLGLLRMTTEVTPTDVRVWFGWIPTYRRMVPIGTIMRLEVVSYRPLADYGGWGIRSGRDGERVLSARGNRGVRLDLSDGSRLLIGSQRPEALALALERAVHPGG
ncbi:MAG: hypothetical protein JO252_07935 [Planctomycetaceae bacterium]|nr:hypothetical protein [Planctomycetaceae bacterium]